MGRCLGTPVGVDCDYILSVVLVDHVSDKCKLWKRLRGIDPVGT